MDNQGLENPPFDCYSQDPIYCQFTSVLSLCSVTGFSIIMQLEGLEQICSKSLFSTKSNLNQIDFSTAAVLLKYIWSKNQKLFTKTGLSVCPSQ